MSPIPPTEVVMLSSAPEARTTLLLMSVFGSKFIIAELPGESTIGGGVATRFRTGRNQAGEGRLAELGTRGESTGMLQTKSVISSFM